MIQVLAAIFVFLATHIIFAEPPVRGWCVAAIGEKPFAFAYGALAILQLVWLGNAIEAAPVVAFWQPPAILHLVPIIVMPLALLLLVCGFTQNNPTATLAPNVVSRREVVGILAVTRNPVMWGLGLWSLAHLLVVSEIAQALRYLAFAALALLGTIRIEQKQRKKWGAAAWSDFASRSSNLPFVAMMEGRVCLKWREIGPTRIFATIGLYAAIVLWFHPQVIGRAVW